MRPPRALAVLRRPPYGSVVVITVTALVMVSLFVTSYTRALGRPVPRQIPTAVVGRPTAHERVLLRGIERQVRSSLQLEPYRSERAARQAIADQRVYAALVLRARPPRLLLASAAGASVARVLAQAAQQAAARAHRRLSVVDVKPLPRSDPQGLVAFYLALAATILGFVCMFQLRANARGLSLRAWLVVVATLSVAAGLVLALIVGPVLSAVHGPFAEMWAILALEVAAAALFCSTMLVLVHRWAIIPTWLLFVVLGNTSSGGAVAPPLLPAFHAFIGRWLPPGATVNALRSAIYFRGHQHLEPFLVLLAWVAGGIVALLVASRLRGTGPALPAD